jgi:hypothetical protein
MKIKINTKSTISGIDLHWNYQKHISIHFWVIYSRTTSTKILTINKYQTIVVSTELSHPSPELSSTEYRDVQFSTDLSKSVPKCPGTEMSTIPCRTQPTNTFPSYS